MASPECVDPWWGSNMVDDPNNYIRNQIPGKENKPEKRKGKEQKKRKKHSLQKITLIPAHTGKLE